MPAIGSNWDKNGGPGISEEDAAKNKRQSKHVRIAAYIWDINEIDRHADFGDSDAKRVSYHIPMRQTYNNRYIQLQREQLVRDFYDIVERNKEMTLPPINPKLEPLNEMQLCYRQPSVGIVISDRALPETMKNIRDNIGKCLTTVAEVEKKQIERGAAHVKVIEEMKQEAASEVPAATKRKNSIAQGLSRGHSMSDVHSAGHSVQPPPVQRASTMVNPNNSNNNDHPMTGTAPQKRVLATPAMTPIISTTSQAPQAPIPPLAPMAPMMAPPVASPSPTLASIAPMAPMGQGYNIALPDMDAMDIDTEPQKEASRLPRRPPQPQPQPQSSSKAGFHGFKIPEKKAPPPRPAATKPIYIQPPKSLPAKPEDKFAPPPPPTSLPTPPVSSSKIELAGEGFHPARLELINRDRNKLEREDSWATDSSSRDNNRDGYRGRDDSQGSFSRDYNKHKRSPSPPASLPPAGPTAPTSRPSLLAQNQYNTIDFELRNNPPKGPRGLNFKPGVPYCEHCDRVGHVLKKCWFANPAQKSGKEPPGNPKYRGNNNNNGNHQSRRSSNWHGGGGGGGGDWDSRDRRDSVDSFKKWDRRDSLHKDSDFDSASAASTSRRSSLEPGTPASTSFPNHHKRRPHHDSLTTPRDSPRLTPVQPVPPPPPPPQPTPSLLSSLPTIGGPPPPLSATKSDRIARLASCPAHTPRYDSFLFDIVYGDLYDTYIKLRPHVLEQQRLAYDLVLKHCWDQQQLEGDFVEEIRMQLASIEARLREVGQVGDGPPPVPVGGLASASLGGSMSPPADPRVAATPATGPVVDVKRDPRLKAVDVGAHGDPRLRLEAQEKARRIMESLNKK